MIAYRLQCKDLSFQYLQTSSRLVYKNSMDCLLQTIRGEGFWGKTIEKG